MKESFKFAGYRWNAKWHIDQMIHCGYEDEVLVFLGEQLKEPLMKKARALAEAELKDYSGDMTPDQFLTSRTRLYALWIAVGFAQQIIESESEEEED